LEEAHFRERLDKLAKTDPQSRDCVAGALAAVANTGLTSEELRSALREAIVSQIGIITRTEFDGQWLKHLDILKEEEQYLDFLAEHRLGKDVESQNGMSGTPLFAVTKLSIPETASVEWTRSIQAEMQAGSSRDHVTIRAPRPENLDPNTMGQVLVNGEVVSSAKIGKTEIEFIPVPGKDPELAVSDGALLVVGEKQFKRAELDMPNLPISPQNDTSSKATAAERHGDLTTANNRIADAYTSQLPDGDIHRDARALALTEYMLAAPPATLGLDVSDVSNVLGVMIDMVRHIGDRGLGEKLFLPGPLEDQTPLSKINLSEHYPAVDSPHFSEIFKYHYDLCENLNKVHDFLSDVAEVRDLLRMLRGSSTRVVIYNETLEEHADEGTNEALCPIAHPSRVIYITRQADAPGLSTLATRIVDLFNKKKEAPRFSLPIIVSPVKLTGAPSLPFIDPSVVALPPMIAMHEEILRDKSKGKGKKLPEDKLLLQLQSSSESAEVHIHPLLLLAASLTLSSSQDSRFGVLGEVHHKLQKELRSNLGVTAVQAGKLVELLRSVWTSPEGPVIPLLLVATWLNVAAAALRSGTEIPKGAFYNWVASVYADVTTRQEIFNAFGTLKEDNAALDQQVSLKNAQGTAMVAQGSGADYSLMTPVQAVFANSKKVQIPAYPALTQLNDSVWRSKGG
jgi:hypothetical protein